MSNEYHIPVLLDQSIEALKIEEDSKIIDATFGAGGHSKLILKLLSAKGHLYAFDQDLDALLNALDGSNFTLFHSNFRYISRFMKLEGVGQVDGILADLGISSHQIDVPERGFAYRYDAVLDMRMNVSGFLSAKDVINAYSEEELVDVFSRYGEVRNSKMLAKEILKVRSGRKIETTSDLNQVLSRVVMGPESKYYAQVYQALRIEVNDEMGALKEFLNSCVGLLKSGGRMAVISYHSLEDRLVKNLFKTGNVDGELVKDAYGKIDRPFKIINKQIIEADKAEQNRNPRSRSAKLRVAQKL
jgi:16S rRNA (cytosine1402-N4)-methyltransferase